MKKLLMIVVLFAMMLAPLSATAQPMEEQMGPTESVEAVYEALIANQDLEGALALFADNAVLTIVPGPGGTDGVFAGKDAIRGWFEGDWSNDRTIFSNVEESGNSSAFTLTYWTPSLVERGTAPYVFDGTSVVQNGQIKSITYVFTPETLAKRAAAKALEANETLVRRILQEIWSEGNLDLVDELIAEDYVSHTWPVVEGRDEYKADVAGWRAHFPGATIVVDKVVFDENQAIIFSHTVGPDGSLDEPPPEDYIEDILIYQIEDGQLSDRWYFAPFDPTE